MKVESFEMDDHGRLGFGLIGTGAAAQAHAKELNKVDGAYAAAVFSRNRARADEFADLHDIPLRFTEYEALLGANVDVVDILTPNGLHLDFAVSAASAGKHVLIEKPLEITLERADTIIRECARHGVVLSVVYQMRYGREVQRLKRAIDQGDFGNVFLIDGYDKAFRSESWYARTPWRGTADIDGGWLFTGTIHIIDLVQWMMGGRVERVVAKTRTARHDIGVEDTAIALLEFGNGAVGVIEGSSATYPAFKQRLEVHGTVGSAIVSGQHDATIFWSIEGDSEIRDGPAGFTFEEASDFSALPIARHRYALQDMVDAIREEREPQVSGLEARKALEIVVALKTSSRSDRWVALDEVRSSKLDPN